MKNAGIVEYSSAHKPFSQPDTEELTYGAKARVPLARRGEKEK